MERYKHDLTHKALLLRSLGHPVRLRIAAGLARRCSCVKEIWEFLGMPQAVVSQHLKVMKDSGLVEARREGVKVCYSLRRGVIADVVQALGLEMECGQAGAGVSGEVQR
jgi:ArsR family transcriptional regulator